MSISPQVRETGTMTDHHGFTVTFGVDHECVTIDARSITIAADDDQFSRLLFAALEAAQAQAGTERTGACCISAGTDEARDAMAESGWEQRYQPGVSDPAGNYSRSDATEGE